MALGDGISYTDYVQIAKALGDTYSSRMVSAEHLILDYLSRRVASEVVLYGTSGLQRGTGRKFANIVPGVTTLGDINIGSVINKDGNERRGADYVIQRGDLIGDWEGKLKVDLQLTKHESDSYAAWFDLSQTHIRLKQTNESTQAMLKALDLFENSETKTPDIISILRTNRLLKPLREQPEIKNILRNN